MLLSTSTATGRPEQVPGSPPTLVGGGRAAVEPPVFEAVYKEHFPFVWRSLRRLGVADSSLADATQDVFLVLHRRLHEFDGRASMKTWLFGIVTRVALHYHRSALRKAPEKPAAPDEVDPEAIADRGSGPAERAEQAEGLRLLHALLSALDSDKRAVFILSELEGMAVPEIAQAVGANVNTVYSRLRAARREFEQALEKHNASEQRRAR